MTIAEISAYATVLLIAILVLRRTRRGTDDAVMTLSIFRNVQLSLVTVTGIMVNLVGFAIMLLAPFYFARMTSLPVFLAGLLLAASPFGIVIGGLYAPVITRRLGAPLLLSLSGSNRNAQDRCRRLSSSTSV